MSDFLTEEQFKKVLPKQYKGSVNPQMIKTINKLIKNSDLRENYRDNLLSYTSVIADGRYKVTDYLNAVMYVSHKLLGSSNIDAYVKTFPDRYQRLMNLGKNADDIANFVSAYNKNQLVNKIFEQTRIPSHILNQDMYQQALNTQVELMMFAKSEKVRSDAANSILVHLKPPETTKIELDIGLKEDKTISELNKTTLELVAQQRKMIEAGAMNAQEVAHSKLLIEDGAVVD